MKFSGVLSAGVLLVALVASSNLAEARRPSCLCGGLGAGTNPCRGESSGGVPVKAAKSPRPAYFASESAINEAAAARAAAAAREAAASASASGGGCGSSSSSSSSSHAGEDYGLSARDLLTLDPHARIAPRFRPIGDLCHHSTSVGSPRTSTTVIPAYPGRPRCFGCDGRLGYGSSSSSSSASASASASASSSSSSAYGSAGSVGYGSHGSQGYGLSGSGSIGCGCNNQHGSSFGGSRPFGAGGPYGGAGGPFGGAGGPFGGAGGPFGGAGGAFGGAGGSFGGAGGPFGPSGVYNSLSSGSSNLNAFEPEDDGLSFDEQESIYNGQQLPTLPADAVSVSLAYKNLLAPHLPQNAINKKKIIPEERLSFGPRTIPADGRVTKAPTTDIPEERLVTVDKPIVELKPISSRGGSGVAGCGGVGGETEEDIAEQEAIERERMEQEAEAQANQGSGAYITYSDLGYGPVGPSGNTFISTSAQTAYASAASAASAGFGSGASGSGGLGSGGLGSGGLGSGGSGSSGSSGYDDGTPCGPLGQPLPGYRAGSVIVRHEGECGGPGCSSSNGGCSSSGHYDDGEDNEESYDAVASYEEDDSSESSGSSQLHAGCGYGSSSSSRSSGGALSRLWSTSGDSYRSGSTATCGIH